MIVKNILSEHLSKLGKKGGQSKSEEKKDAARRNIEKALEKRWPGRKFTGKIAARRKIK
jgi:hypothetical protein